MLRVRSFALLLSLFSLVAAAQDSTESVRQLSDDVPPIQLKDAFTREVPFVALDLLTIPILCAHDGTSFVQLVGATGRGDILAISRNGNEVVRFSLSKINDISQPSPRNLGVTDSDVYVLLSGNTPENKVLTFKKPNGETLQQPAVRSLEYVAHFKKDGGYLGAVRLDLPFQPLQIGVFPSGDFLIAGYEKTSFEPRIALVKSSGQFQRFVQLPGDLHPSGGQPVDNGSVGDKNTGPESLPQFGETISDGLWGALNLSMTIADGRNILLVRLGYRIPVFSVSPGGEVTAINLEMPAEYSLADLKVGNHTWVGIYTRTREDGNGLQIETFVHDPATGKAIARYTYPRTLGLAVGCVSQDQMSFMTTQDGKLILNTLSIPAPSPNKAKPLRDSPR